VQDFFSSAESKAFVKVTESIGFVHQGSLGPTHGEAYDRISVNDPFLRQISDSTGLLSFIASHFSNLIEIYGSSYAISYIHIYITFTSYEFVYGISLCMWGLLMSCKQSIKML
jgi:hypothetical protein